MQADKSKLKSRVVKGYPLTHAELDGNFTELSKLIDDVTIVNQDIDAIELDVAQKNTDTTHAINTQSDRITALTDAVAVIDNAKQPKLAAVYNDNVLANANKVWGLNAAGTGYEWKDPRVAAGLPTPVGQAKKLLGVKADGTLEYQIVGQKVGDLLVTAGTPDATYVQERKVYLKTSYPDLATKLGTLGDESPILTQTSTGMVQAQAGYAFGNGIHVTVGASNSYMSTDGITWTAIATLAGASYSGVAFGAGLFVAFQADTAATSCLTSPDGVTWTSRAMAVTGGVYSGRPVYGNGVFVVCSGTSANWGTSVDGITWVTRATPGNSPTSLNFLNGLFVATFGSAPFIKTSADGVTWSTPTLPASTAYLSQSAYGNGRYVVLGNTTNTGNWGVTSTDGVT